MSNLRKLNDSGLDLFIKYCKDNANISNEGPLNNDGENSKSLPNLPFDFDDDEYTEELPSNIKINDKPWENSSDKERFAIAKHINSLEISDDDLYDLKLWAWLSIFYWNKVVNTKKWLNRVEHYIPLRFSHEKERINEIYQHGPILNAPDLRSRHNIWGPCEIYRLYGEKGKIFISKNPTELGDKVEQPISRKWLSACKDIFIQYLEQNFVDPSSKELNVSFSSGSGFGSGLRLIEVMNIANYAYNLRKVPLDEFSKIINNKNNPEFP